MHQVEVVVQLNIFADNDCRRETIVAQISEARDGEDGEARGQNVPWNIGARHSNRLRNIFAEVGVESFQIESGKAKTRLIDLHGREDVRFAHDDLIDRLRGYSWHAGPVPHSWNRQETRLGKVVAAEAVTHKNGIGCGESVIDFDIKAIACNAADRIEQI